MDPITPKMETVIVADVGPRARYLASSVLLSQALAAQADLDLLRASNCNLHITPHSGNLVFTGGDPELLLGPQLARAWWDNPKTGRRIYEDQWECAPTAEKVGRNDPCPCGSGEKYKRCCLQ